MSEETLPVPIPTQISIRKDLLTSLAEIERVAVACAQSGYYSDVRDASQAVVKMLAGREMGIGPIQSIAGIHIVDGKPTAGANLIAANVKRSGRYDYRVKERTNERCALEWFDGGVSVGQSEFSLQDAKRAGLDSKNNWKKYPRAMCFARALTEGVRVFCPDAGAGIIYTPEELQPDLEISEDGEVIDTAPITPEPKVNHRNTIGEMLLIYMQNRCREKEVDPDIYAKGALRSILQRLEVQNTPGDIKANEAAIRAEIDKWDFPDSEPNKAIPRTFGGSPNAMRRIHAWVGETLGYRGQEGHDLLHAALPEGVESLSDLEISEEATLMEGCRKLAQAKNDAEGSAF